MNLFSNAWNEVEIFTSSALTTIETVATDTWNEVETFTSDTFNTVETVATDTWNGVETFTSDTFNTVETFVSDAWDTTKNNILEAGGYIFIAIVCIPELFFVLPLCIIAFLIGLLVTTTLILFNK